MNLNNSNVLTVFIVLILLFILINRKTVFNTFLGRLFIIIALVCVTSYNMLAGVLLVLIFMVMNNHFISDFEGIENTPEPDQQAQIKQKITAEMASLGIPTSSESEEKIEQPSTTDVAEKERKLLVGNQSNSLPVSLNQTSENAVANNPGKEGFMSYASLY